MLPQRVASEYIRCTAQWTSSSMDMYLCRGPVTKNRSAMSNVRLFYCLERGANAEVFRISCVPVSTSIFWTRTPKAISRTTISSRGSRISQVCLCCVKERVAMTVDTLMFVYSLSELLVAVAAESLSCAWLCGGTLKKAMARESWQSGTRQATRPQAEARISIGEVFL